MALTQAVPFKPFVSASTLKACALVGPHLLAAESASGFTLRRDNEPAIGALAREIAQARQEGTKTVLEKPPVGESQSIGIIERAVGLVAGQARTLKTALEHRIGTRVPSDARILCWLVDFAVTWAATERHRCTAFMGERTTHRSWSSERRLCTCLPNQQVVESGTHDSILECSWRC